MPSNIRIESLKVSTIFFEAFSQLLDGLTPQGASMAFIGQLVGYVDAFSRAKEGNTPWTLPWPGERPALNHFWRYYMDNRSPARVEGRTAWKYLVPLRRVVRNYRFALQGEGQVEAFFYPHGVGLVLTNTLDREALLSNMVDFALRTQLALPNRVYGAADYTANGPSILDLQRMDMLGNESSPGLVGDPFTVATVLHGSEVDSTMPVVDGGELHHALQGMCSWNPNWDTVDPDPLSSSCLRIHAAPPGHMVYASRRGRSIWFPAFFDRRRVRKNTLGCYHRNLTLLSLQVEGLLQLARLVGSHICEGQHLSFALTETARRGTDILGRLYGGALGTYHSCSAPRQVDDSGLRPVVDQVRNSFGKHPLFPNP